MLWAPSFMLCDFGGLEEIVVRWLSTPVGTYLLMGCPDQDYSQDVASFTKSWQADIDVSKHFNNFQAHEDERPYLGVRMYETRNDGSFEKQWFARYTRLHFGGQASPYIVCQGQSRILEWAIKPPWDESSSFRWDNVVLNLPTDNSWDWDPCMPRVMLLRKDGELATRLVDYVDDIHPSVCGKDVQPSTDVAHFLKSRMNSVGNMVSKEKYRRPTPTSQTAAEGYPPLIRITDELIKHCEALSQLFDTEEPRTLDIRPSSANKFRYYVGDASAEGFGGATSSRRGVWS